MEKIIIYSKDENEQEIEIDDIIPLQNDSITEEKEKEEEERINDEPIQEILAAPLMTITDTSTFGASKSKKRKNQHFHRKDNWSSDMTLSLIKHWRSESVLYEVKHPKYYDKYEREDAMRRVVFNMASDGFATTPDATIVKMNSLRSYFANR